MHEQNWRSMTPDYSQYQAILEQYNDLLPATTGTLQDRLSDAVRRFTAVELQPRVLRITAPDNKVYRDYVIELISQQAEAKNESPVIVAGENVTELSLFGAVYPPVEENNINKQQVKHGWFTKPTTATWCFLSVQFLPT